MRNKQLSLILFLFLQIYIYISLISFNEIINDNIMFFASSLLCLIISLFLFCKTKDYYIMILAIFISVVGDVFFTFFKNLDYLGLMCLNLVQVLYFLRIYLDSDYKKYNLISRFIFLPVVTIITFLILKENTDVNAILWVLFTTNLFINILFTIKEIGLNNLFPMGLLLLFMFSTCILLSSLDPYLKSNIHFLNLIENLPFDIKNVFYIPAQVVLTCSIFTVNRRCFSKIKQDDEE